MTAARGLSFFGAYVDRAIGSKEVLIFPVGSSQSQELV